MLLLALLVVLGQVCLAQAFNYGNAWYQVGASYVRLKVGGQGIYRATPQQLVGAGLDTVGLNLDNLHLLYRGQEQYLHVDTAGGTWNFIEFIGARNDAGLDSLLYMDPFTNQADGSLMPHPYRSSFGDTATFYLYRDNVPGLRFIESNIVTAPPPIGVLQRSHTSLREFAPGVEAQFRTDYRNAYDIFLTQNPEWTVAEGYNGPNFGPGNDLVLQIPTPHPTNNGQTRLLIRLASMESFARAYEISLAGNVLVRDTVQQPFVKGYELDYNFTLVGDTQTLRIHLDPMATPIGDRSYLNYAGITYGSSNILDGGTEAKFPRNNATNGYFKFRQVGAGSVAVGYDLVNHVRQEGTVQGDSIGIWIPANPMPGMMLVNTDSGMGSPEVLPGIASNLSSNSHAADLVLITDPSLATSALAYQSYRQGSSTNPLVVKVVYTDEIYNEFSDGSAHPLGIKRFCKWAMDQWAGAPHYFLLWGKGSANLQSGGPNLVPAYGTPASDALYLSGYERDSVGTLGFYSRQATIGRVPIVNDAEGLAYIGKLQAYEGGLQADWMRNAVLLGAATDSLYLHLVRDVLDTLRLTLNDGPLYARPWTYTWNMGQPMDTMPQPHTAVIDTGAALVVGFGPSTAPLGLGAASTWNNHGRLPLLVGLGCNWGDFGHDTTSVAEDWLLHPDQGAAACVSASGYTFLIPSYYWTQRLGHWLLGSAQLSLGASADSAGRDYLAVYGTDREKVNHVMQMNVLGDPSLRMRSGGFSVWPGDANDDLQVNNHDLLYLGVAYGDTGATRSNASLNWVAQSATPWDSAFASGTNHVHADCDGDGMVTDNDTLGVVQNYGLSHNKWAGVLGLTGSGPLLSVDTVVQPMAAGSRVALVVRLGSAQAPADSAYGLAWSLYLDPALVDTGSISVDFDSCWLRGTGDHLLHIAKFNPQSSTLDMAVTRTDQVVVSGEGVVARIGIVVIDNISGKLPGDTVQLPLYLQPSDARLVGAQGQDLPLQGQMTKLVVVSALQPEPLPSGIDFACYPNPTAGDIFLQTRSDSPCQLRVLDLQGRLVYAARFDQGALKRLDLRGLALGSYVLEAENSSGTWHGRIQIQ